MSRENVEIVRRVYATTQTLLERAAAGADTQRLFRVRGLWDPDLADAITRLRPNELVGVGTRVLRTTSATEAPA